MFADLRSVSKEPSEYLGCNCRGSDRVVDGLRGRHRTDYLSEICRRTCQTGTRTPKERNPNNIVEK